MSDFQFWVQEIICLLEQIKQYGYLIFKNQSAKGNHVQSHFLQHGHSCSSIPPWNSYFQLVGINNSCSISLC
jgi:hypothetical protein